MEEIQHGSECGATLLGITFYVSSLRGGQRPTWQSLIDSDRSPRSLSLPRNEVSDLSHSVTFVTLPPPPVTV